MDDWKKVGEGTSNNQWRFMNLHYKDTGPKKMRPGHTVSVKNCLFIYQMKLDVLKQYLLYKIHHNYCALYIFKKTYVTTTSLCWTPYLYSQSHWLKHEFVMCYFITLRKWISSNKNLSKADLWHTEHENSMWECT